MITTQLEYRNCIVDYLFAPTIVLKEDVEIFNDFTEREKELFQKDVATLKSLRADLSAFKKEIEDYYLTSNNLSLLHYIYFELLEQQKDPKTLDEFYEMSINLSQTSFDRVLRLALSGSTDEKKYDDRTLWELLEESNKNDAQKWKWARIIQNPKEYTKKLVEISQKVSEIYAPYFESAKQSRINYFKQFSLSSFFEAEPQFNISKMVTWDFQNVLYFQINPWFACFMISATPVYHNASVIVVVSERIPEVIGSKKTIELDDISLVLKSLSDLTRYRVLVELIQPNAKSKDIAKKLSITGAAVSFHMQKLVNTGILQHKNDDKNYKFEVNKTLLKQIFAKILSDFKLDN